ncbi:MAG: putative metal-binding motif-containing protein [Myxococcota bacterium]|jgi:hypothetical protein|nr:putative metal-binding motif-containing protein [Myxococcota bacterium]
MLSTKTRISAVAALFLMIGFACMIDDVNIEQSEVYSCMEDKDCLDGFTCHEGFCVKSVPEELCEDLDEDGYYAGPGCVQPPDQRDCNDTPGEGRTIFPNAPEKCNNIDDNCNGTADEKLEKNCAPPAPSKKGEGVCAEITVVQSCVAGELDPPSCDYNCPGANCVWGPNFVPDERSPEHCDGLDNDCDGDVDEGCAVECVPDQPCEAGCIFTDYPSCACKGRTVCVEGVSQCQNSLGVEPYSIGAKPEICGNGVDDNCNDETDEAGCTEPPSP